MLPRGLISVKSFRLATTRRAPPKSSMRNSSSRRPAAVSIKFAPQRTARSLRISGRLSTSPGAVIGAIGSPFFELSKRVPSASPSILRAMITRLSACAMRACSTIGTTCAADEISISARAMPGFIITAACFASSVTNSVSARPLSQRTFSTYSRSMTVPVNSSTTMGPSAPMISKISAISSARAGSPVAEPVSAAMAGRPSSGCATSANRSTATRTPFSRPRQTVTGLAPAATVRIPSRIIARASTAAVALPSPIVSRACQAR